MVLVAVTVFLLRIPQEIIELIGFTLLASVVITVLGCFVLFGAIAKQKYRNIKADTRLKEAQASKAENEAAQNNYLMQSDGYGMLHLINVLTGHSQNLTLDARAYRNGHFEEPHPIELENLRNILASRHAGTAKTILEQSTPQLLPPKLDLLRVFTQPTQSYAIIGGQQVGKTFQAIRVANYWLQSGIKPIVIGPKWDKGEWEGCAKFGGEYNFEKVAQGMQIIKKLAMDRHADTSKSHKQHSIQPVFFDDWTAIRATIKEESENFIIDATTLYASVNIILYFIIHLDTGAAWGVDKVGASLKNNFIKLIVQPGYNSLGEIDRTKNIGWLIMPGQTIKDKQKIDLFSGNGSVLALPDLVIQPSENLAQVERESNDAKFVRLVGEGKSRNEAAQQAWGRRYAGDLVERGKALLGEKVSTTT